MGMPVHRMALSKKKKRAFLTALIMNGGLAEPAAREVGYTSSAYLRQCRKNDEDFAEAWDDAIEVAGDLIEAEVYRRAIHGVQEPVYYKGEVVGYINKYSDKLAELLLKRHKPEYRETGRSDGVTVNVGVAVMPAAAKNEEDWEARTVVMHDGQEPIALPDKPQENNLLDRNTIKRGD